RFTATIQQVGIVMASGNNQTAVLNSPLPQPLVVSVSGTSPTALVTWDTRGLGTANPNPSPIVGGKSQTIFTVGPTSTAITVTATVTQAGITASVDFSVNNVTQTAVAGLKSFTAMAPVAISTATVQTSNLALRLATLRKGAGGVSMSGL